MSNYFNIVNILSYKPKVFNKYQKVGLTTFLEKAVINAYQVVKYEVNATTALVKSGYHKAAEMISKVFDNSSNETTSHEAGSSNTEVLSKKIFNNPSEEKTFSKADPSTILTSPPLPEGWEEIDLSGDDAPLVFIN